MGLIILTDWGKFLVLVCFVLVFYVLECLVRYVTSTAKHSTGRSPFNNKVLNSLNLLNLVICVYL